MSHLNNLIKQVEDETYVNPRKITANVVQMMKRSKEECYIDAKIMRFKKIKSLE